MTYRNYILFLFYCGLSLSCTEAPKSPVDTSTNIEEDTGTPVDSEPLEDSNSDDEDSDSDWQDTDSDDDTETALQIYGIAPNYSTDVGGQEITLYGGPFEDVTDITFGGLPGIILEKQSNYMVASTPASPYSGSAADIAINTDTQFAFLSDKFAYWPDGTDKIGTVGQVSWFQYLGGYWADGTVNSGVAEVIFTAPTDLPYWQLAYSGAMDHCALNYANEEVFYVYSPMSPTLEMTASSSATITLDQNTDPNLNWSYFASGLDNTQVFPGATYVIEEVHNGLSYWPQFVGNKVVEMPQGIAVTAPLLDQTNMPLIPESFPFEWVGPGSSDYAIIFITRMHWTDASATWTEVEKISCTVQDDGNFQFPGGWTNWMPYSSGATEYDGVLIQVGRAFEAGGSLPYNHSHSGMPGIVWAVGFGAAQ